MITPSDAWRLLYIIILASFVLILFGVFEWLPDYLKRNKLWRKSRKRK